jgi:hypothetical protein
LDKEAEDVYQTTDITMMTTKNYLVVPFLETTIQVNFKRGFTSIYTGLYELAKQYGFFTDETTQSVIVPSYDSKKKIKLKDLMYSEKSKEIWDTFIKDLDEKQTKDIQYSSFVDQDFTETSEDENINVLDINGNKKQEKSPIQMI